jgi:hypothetical protein
VAVDGKKTKCPAPGTPAGIAVGDVGYPDKKPTIKQGTR